ncbi:MAG: CPBP family intramembrane metalloprotease [Actinobacteria bacterium]|nr:MAG: CPBP family intramembrane metalloprotease [Actinomycetota bacterium]
MRRWSRGRIAAWAAIVGALAAANYAVRFSGSSSSAANERDALYHYSSAVSGLIFYALFFAFVYAVAAVDTDELFALRRPRSIRGAVGYGFAAIAGVYVVSAALSPFLNAGKEQGLTPSHWEPSHAGAYAANFVVVALVAPVVEELTFRGVGYGLLEQYGRPLAIVVVGIAFGLAHGLVEALPVLAAFGMLLTWLRAKTDSVIPGMIVHALFNSIALVAAVTT